MVDLSTVGTIGASGSVLAVLAYAGARVTTRVVDHVFFLAGLRMILRSTSGTTRQTAVLAYLGRRQVADGTATTNNTEPAQASRSSP